MDVGDTEENKADKCAHETSILAEGKKTVNV